MRGFPGALVGLGRDQSLAFVRSLEDDVVFRDEVNKRLFIKALLQIFFVSFLSHLEIKLLLSVLCDIIALPPLRDQLLNYRLLLVFVNK